MSIYKEIVTKAVIGKAKKKSTNSYNLIVQNEPNTVLGCWVINHEFKGSNIDGKVYLSGSYDVNVWYSYENDKKTAVEVKKFTYNDTLAIPLKNNTTLNSSHDIIVNALRQPSVVDVDIINGSVNLKVEKEMGIEIIGDTTVKIAVEDTNDDYVEIFDSKDDEELNIDIDELDDNYIEESTK